MKRKRNTFLGKEENPEGRTFALPPEENKVGTTNKNMFDIRFTKAPKDIIALGDAFYKAQGHRLKTWVLGDLKGQIVLNCKASFLEACLLHGAEFEIESVNIPSNPKKFRKILLAIATCLPKKEGVALKKLTIKKQTSEVIVKLN